MLDRFIWLRALRAADDGGAGGGGTPAPAAAAAPPGPGGDPAPATAPAAGPAPGGTPAAAEPAKGEGAPPADAPKPADPLKPVADILEEPPEETEQPKLEGETEKPGDAPQYAEFTLPDTFKADEAVMGEFKTLAGEMKLPQAEAQRLVDLYTREVGRLAAEPLRAWNDTKSAWQAEIKAMPEFQGAALRDARRTIIGALDAHPNGAALRQGLEATGAINHPAVFRFINEWAAANSEKPLARGNRPAPGAKTPGERVYGNS